MVQLSKTGNLLRPEQRHERGVGGNGRGQHEADGVAGQIGETLGHEPRADEHAAIGDDAGEIVRGGGFAGMREGLAHEGLEDRRARRWKRRPRHRRAARSRFRELDGLAPCRLRRGPARAPQLADGGGDLVAAKTEALLDGLREVHAVEAVEAEIFEQRRGLFLGFGQRALEFFLEDVEARPAGSRA